MADTYHAYLLKTGIADYQGTPGNRGVCVFRRAEDDGVDFKLLKMWDSVDAIKVFAGDAYEQARYYPEYDDYLLEREAYVRHLEVLYASPHAGAGPAHGTIY